MFAAFLRKLLGLHGSSTGDDGAKAPQANSDPTRAIAKQADGDSKDESTAMVAYDENLLERSRTQWQFGDWSSLSKLDRDTLRNHPDRAKLALLAAAGHLQQGDSQAARQLTSLAQDWGCSKKLISQLLIAGIHNSLGRAVAASGNIPKAQLHFQASIQVGAPTGDVQLLAQARAANQIFQLEQ